MLVQRLELELFGVPFHDRMPAFTSTPFVLAELHIVLAYPQSGRGNMEDKHVIRNMKDSVNSSAFPPLLHIMPAILQSETSVLKGQCREILDPVYPWILLIWDPCSIGWVDFWYLEKSSCVWFPKVQNEFLKKWKNDFDPKPRRAILIKVLSSKNPRGQNILKIKKHNS